MQWIRGAAKRTETASRAGQQHCLSKSTGGGNTLSKIFNALPGSGGRAVGAGLGLGSAGSTFVAGK